MLLLYNILPPKLLSIRIHRQRLARFEESRIMTGMAGEASALPPRGWTDGKHQRASSLALDGSSRRENAAERDGQRPGDTPEPPKRQQADDSKVGDGSGLKVK